jgi:hypothetical protein
MTREQMIEALAKSNNEIVADKCKRILNRELSIEDALDTSGSFMTYVLKGMYKEAIQVADTHNKIALYIYKDENNPIHKHND